MREAIVYTETVVYAPPQQYAADSPYQLAIVDLPEGGRLTVRIVAETEDGRVSIGDKVLFVENRGGVAYFRKASGFD